jgi:raffinose/stachyose/melibiose transport system permease protein
MGAGVALSLLPAVALFTAFYVAPLATLVVTSFAEWSYLGFSWVGLDNFEALLHDGRFWHAAKNTVAYCAASVFIQVPLGVAAGMLLARKLPGWRAIRTILFVPVVISGAVYALSYSIFFNPQYGLLNQTLGSLGLGGTHDWLFDVNTALPAVVATYVFIIGFVMILVSAEIAQIPGELYEAAQVDGASWWQRERYITLPSLRHIVGTCVLLTLLGTLKLFDVVYIMTAGGPADATATLGTYAYDRYTGDQWGYANAVGVATVIVGFLIIVSIRRAFRIGDQDA